jgi:hypothetical protein
LPGFSTAWHDRFTKAEMRRALSMSLILLLWLPAVSALLPGAADARLPFCCRRQGAHHCEMEAMAGGQMDHSGPALTAPSHCPRFPASLPATISPVFATAGVPADWPALVSAMVTRVAGREAARAGRLRAQLDRGPPSSVPA